MSEQSALPRSTLWMLTMASVVVILAAVQAAEAVVTPFLIAFESSNESRWLAVLLGSEDDLTADA